MLLFLKHQALLLKKSLKWEFTFQSCTHGKRIWTFRANYGILYESQVMKKLSGIIIF